jgi:hypothetical protein
MRTATAVLAAAVLAAGARADDDARKLVEKAVAAVNPPQKAAGMTWRDKGTLTAAGMALKYTADWWVAFPDKERFVLDTEFMGQKLNLTLVVNGDKAWESAFGKTQEVAGDKLDYVRGEVYQLWVLSLRPLLTDKEFTLTRAADVEVGKRKCPGVTVERKGKPAVAIHFDPETGVPVRAAMKTKDEFQNWKEVTDEAFFEDYKDVDGRKVFAKLRVVRDGKPLIESALSDARWHETMEAKLFEKPKG